MSLAFRAREIWNHPAGPKTIFFWAPTFKWGITIANISDLSRDPSTISIPMQAALTVTGVIWSKYSLDIRPKNYNLLAVNMTMAATGIYQLYRIYSHEQQQKRARWRSMGAVPFVFVNYYNIWLWLMFFGYTLRLYRCYFTSKERGFGLDYPAIAWTLAWAWFVHIRVKSWCCSDVALDIPTPNTITVAFGFKASWLFSLAPCTNYLAQAVNNMTHDNLGSTCSLATFEKNARHLSPSILSAYCKGRVHTLQVDFVWRHLILLSRMQNLILFTLHKLLGCLHNSTNGTLFWRNGGWYVHASLSSLPCGPWQGQICTVIEQGLLVQRQGSSVITDRWQRSLMGKSVDIHANTSYACTMKRFHSYTLSHFDNSDCLNSEVNQIEQVFGHEYRIVDILSINPNSQFCNSETFKIQNFKSSMVIRFTDRRYYILQLFWRCTSIHLQF